MGHFICSFGFAYILVLVDYVSRWIKVVAIRAEVIETMVKHVTSLILHRYGMPRTIINGREHTFVTKS